jgi:hypothetical protein
MSEWIDIRDKHPGFEVVVIYQSQNRGLDIAYFETGHGFTSIITKRYCEHPTHWMPIPKIGGVK